jgi:acyl-coenzyme A thioesterase PaaI-like protein
MENWPKLDLENDGDYSMCIGCGESNPSSLKLKFEWDGTTATAEYNPSLNHQGWSGYLHGGVTALVLDESMVWAAMFSGLHCVTAKMQVRYRQMVPVGKTYLVSCSVTRQTRRLVETKAVLTDQDGEIYAEGTSTQFVVKSAEERPSKK